MDNNHHASLLEKICLSSHKVRANLASTYFQLFKPFRSEVVHIRSVLCLGPGRLSCFSAVLAEVMEAGQPHLLMVGKYFCFLRDLLGPLFDSLGMSGV